MTAQVSYASNAVPFRYERVGSTTSQRSNAGGRPRSSTQNLTKKYTLAPAPVYTAPRFAVQAPAQVYPATPHTAVSMAMSSTVPSPAPGTLRRHHIPPLSAAGLPFSAVTPTTGFPLQTPVTSGQRFFPAQYTDQQHPQHPMSYAVIYDSVGNQFISATPRVHEPPIAFQQQPQQSFTVSHPPPASRRRPSLGSPYPSGSVSYRSPPSTAHGKPVPQGRTSGHRTTQSFARGTSSQSNKPDASSSVRSYRSMTLSHQQSIAEGLVTDQLTSQNAAVLRKRSLASMTGVDKKAGSADLRKSQRQAPAQTSAVDRRGSAQDARAATPVDADLP